MLKRFGPCLVLVPALLGAELPVRQVILYKHGVGFFERSGSIPEGESARLDFKAGEMNDVLKSLTIDEKNAQIFGLRYDSAIPLSDKLGEFPFTMGPAAPLSGLLDQLKGARIELQFAAEKIAGSIVSARLVAADRDHAEREQLALLLDSGDLRTFDLAAASSIRFTDPKVQTQFRDYLATVTQSRSKEKRSVYIDSNSKEARDIKTSYIIPTPIWKSSYRLLLTDGPEPTLEGWAIVDNTTGEDWTNVQMALVSGRPISFISQLYEPRYVEREEAELTEEQPAKPKLHAFAMKRAIGNVSESVIVSGAAPAAAKASTISAAQGQDVADLFEYRISQPVTIKQNQSAMLPFLQQGIKARKVVLFTGSDANHPLSAAELTNSTGKTLDGGPITVYDGGTYVGEALVETVKANDKRFISYGVDLGTRITNKLDSRDEEVRKIRAERGVVTTTFARVRKTTYTIKNLDARAKTLVIEHAIEQGFALVDQKATETTPNAWRFEMKLAPSASAVFPVLEQNIFSSSSSVSNWTVDTVISSSLNSQIGETGRKQFERIAALKRQIAENSNRIAQAEKQLTDASKNEDRLRANVQSLNSVAGQQTVVQGYAKQLSTVDASINQMQSDLSDLRTKATELQMQLNDVIAQLAF